MSITANPLSGAVVEEGSTITITSTAPLQTILYRRTGYADETIRSSGMYAVGYSGSASTTTYVFRRDAGWDVPVFQIVCNDGATVSTVEYYIVDAGEYPTFMRPWGVGPGPGGTGSVAHLDDIGDVDAAAPDDLDVVSWDAQRRPGSHDLRQPQDCTLSIPIRTSRPPLRQRTRFLPSMGLFGSMPRLKAAPLAARMMSQTMQHQLLSEPRSRMHLPTTMA